MYEVVGIYDLLPWAGLETYVLFLVFIRFPI
jgi:hypothetical protein